MQRSGLLSLRLLLLLWAGSRGDTCLSQPHFSLEVQENKLCVRVPIEQPNEQTLAPEKALQVFVAAADPIQSADLPPVLGSYLAEQDHLVFCPLFPFRPQVQYRVVLEGKELGEFDVPKAPGATPPGIRAVFPSADTLPANLLKIYLHFATPMNEGHVYAHVQILNDRGIPLVDPFVQLEPALWDKEARRLTLWLDPGRVKRALGPNELLGPVLLPERTYTLQVDSLWRDAQGQALGSAFSRRFWVSPDDRERPDIRIWSVQAPRQGLRDSLRIDFGESLDQALALQCLTIEDRAGTPVAGRVSVGNGERTWTFVPERPWQAGRYRLRVQTRLEDVAGNNLNRLFDRDLLEEPATPSEAAEQDFMFEVH